MTQIVQTGRAGTLESNDILITVSPGAAGEGIAIELISPVIRQFGDRIREVITETLTTLDINDARVQATDKGALDCTIRARVRTAAGRAAKGGD